jgi:allophanate hydrolase
MAVYGWTIKQWRAAYRDGSLRPEDMGAQLEALVAADDTAWILRPADCDLSGQLRRLAERLAAVGGELERLPLYGVPFAIKDNLDVAGLPTTAACPAFAYTASATASVVQKLLDAGAILVGKTNLDQFATGLVGTRSPYGPVPNAFDARVIAGGSSSGSASVVARGVVPFALATDTAGSGRVPAGLNNLVAIKPTRGWLSSRGLVPACRSLDCVAVFATTVDDAQTVCGIMAGFDALDAYSRPAPADAAARRLPARPRIAVPAGLPAADAQAVSAWQAALAGLHEMGAELVEIDFAPMQAVAAMLYDGPWLAERLAAVEGFIAEHAQDMHPVVRQIISQGARFTAVDAFRAEYRRMALAREIAQATAGFDALLVPTAPIAPTIEAVLADPVALNSRLGTYTNFVNLLDLCALALPAGMRADGIPFGITLIAAAWSDAALVEYGRRWQQFRPWPLGATGRSAPGDADAAASPAAPAEDTVRVAVVGAHLSGMPLNGQLTERAARLVERTQTSAAYRLYALPGTVPPKPGLAKVGQGAAIEVELWDMPVSAFGSFVALIPPPLGIGSLQLADGRMVKGFICEAWALQGATDITAYGGWRAYIASLAG